LKSFYFKLFSIILISSLGIVVYSNAFHCTFHFDDKYFIIDNYAIRDLGSLKNIWEYYPTRFFTFLSIALNYHFNKLDVFDYHVFNLAVHLTSAFLVWWLILLTLSTPQIKGDDKGKSGNKKKTFVKSEPAFKLSEENPIVKHAQLIALLVALVFVSHPLQTEAVTYIWQRAASMAALFYLASLCFYIKSRLLMLDCHPEAVRPKDLKVA